MATFIKPDGVCEFKGPFKFNHLAWCADDCRDFETLEEAMTRCLELDECGGISFSHMYWGDRKSSGPHRGYGY